MAAISEKRIGLRWCWEILLPTPPDVFLGDWLRGWW
jgi:hypothetical protein